MINVGLESVFRIMVFTTYSICATVVQITITEARLEDINTLPPQRYKVHIHITKLIPTSEIDTYVNLK